MARKTESWSFAPSLLLTGLFLGLSCSEERAPATGNGESFSSGTLDPRNMVGTPDPELHPTLVHPRYLGAEDADKFLRPDDPVTFIVLGSTRYVYPDMILGFHHVINETIQKVPLAITQCMLSGSAILYERRLGDKPLILTGIGTTYYGNMVLQDEETGSRWTQLTGTAFDGKLRNNSFRVARALEKTTWSRVKASGPCQVIAPLAPMDQYRGFFDNIRKGGLGLSLLERTRSSDKRLPAYTKGLGLVMHGNARFYPLDVIRETGVINEELGEWGVALVHDPDLDTPRVFRRDVDGKRLTLLPSAGGLRDSETGSGWDFWGTCVGGPLAGRRLARPEYTEVYWFAWAAFHPRTSYAERRKP